MISGFEIVPRRRRCWKILATMGLPLCIKNSNVLVANGLSSSSSSRLSSSSPSSERELFSVAPMMAHSNRHYRYFFRLLSNNAHLYTEMIPANQIVQLYDTLVSKQYDHPHGPEQIQENVHRIMTLQRNPPRSYPGAPSDPNSYALLQELVHGSGDNVALQLGGRDPRALAKAAAIATAFGYASINLNCGCPSSSVASDRGSGAALMREPELVARCLEAMSAAVDPVDPRATLSVKHRLGVADAGAYDAARDHEEDDDRAHRSCSDFCKIVGMAGKVSKLHVHARLALLGLGTDGDDGASPPVSPWTLDGMTHGGAVEKIDHRRVQYKAKRRSRQATIQNRSVPPLRPGVVERIAREFPRLEVVSNGGISSVPELEGRLSSGAVAGAMVGRAAINHPCSFAAVDSVLWGDGARAKRSRGRVLREYAGYCEEQESRFEAAVPSITSHRRKEFRRKLVAAPFHLFMGEDGNSKYQRRLRKLASRGDRHTASSMLLAAMAEVPGGTLDKCVDEHVPWKDIETFDFIKRSGAMQRTIY